jgi:hypothetical protein
VVSGAPVVLSSLTSDITSSIKVLLIAALIVMALTLLAAFRSPPRRAARLLPLAVALAAVGILFGAMAVVGASLTMASIAVLPVLVGLAVDYAIQFHSRHDEVMRAEGLTAREAAPRAAALGGPTIATACLATGAGFLVLLLSPVPMVRGFGLLLVIGIALAFGCALTAGFAALTLVPPPRSAPGRRRRMPGAVRAAGEILATAVRGARDLVIATGAPRVWEAVSRRVTTAWSAAMRAAVERPARVLAIAVAVALVGFVADTQTKVVSDVQKLVPQDSPALRDLDTLQRETGVSGEIDVTVEADDLTDPQVIRWMTGYQAAVLKRFGYSEKGGCRRARLCPALSLPSLFRDPTQAEDRTRIRALLDAVPPYFSRRDHAGPPPGHDGLRHPSDAARDRQQKGDRGDCATKRLEPAAGREHAPGRRAPGPGGGGQREGCPSDWRRLPREARQPPCWSRSRLLAVHRGPESSALVPLDPDSPWPAGWTGALVLFAIRCALNPMSVTLGALVRSGHLDRGSASGSRSAYAQERIDGLPGAEALARDLPVHRGWRWAASGANGDRRVFRGPQSSPTSGCCGTSASATVVESLAVSLLGVLLVLPAVLVLDGGGELHCRCPDAGVATARARALPEAPAAACWRLRRPRRRPAQLYADRPRARFPLDFRSRRTRAGRPGRAGRGSPSPTSRRPRPRRGTSPLGLGGWG